MLTRLAIGQKILYACVTVFNLKKKKKKRKKNNNIKVESYVLFGGNF